MNILCNISLGELLDKISILRIKQKKILDSEKLGLVTAEHDLLLSTLNKLKLNEIEKELTELMKINNELWEIEDKIRIKERNKNFDQEFIELARSVYITNDKRFEIKNRINNMFGSSLKEVKSYA